MMIKTDDTHQRDFTMMKVLELLVDSIRWEECMVRQAERVEKKPLIGEGGESDCVGAKAHLLGVALLRSSGPASVSGPASRARRGETEVL